MGKNKLKIKVCGMRDNENIRHLVKLRPDLIGFILYPGSKRYVGEEYTITVEIPKSIIRVGVFVNALMNEVIHWVNQLNLKYVQLHGTESPEYCRELAEMKIGVIKAFGIDETFDFNVLDPYVPYCDYFLFDTKSDAHGGSGRKFNWKLLDDYQKNKEIIIGGGIGPDDIETISLLNTRLPIFAVDINSCFETEPGIKDIKQVKQFLRLIQKK
jgi:phosphoribosylanthranilate isomerase